VSTAAIRSKSVAVTVIGVTTMLLGGAYAALGGSLLFDGAAAIMSLEDDAAGGYAPLLQVVVGFVAVVGVALLVQGAIGLLAGLGVVMRRPWGRALTFLLAILAVLWGLLFVSANQEPIDLALGAAQILYGILAFVVLIKDGADFSRRRV
jgi:hypothetical protein